MLKDWEALYRLQDQALALFRGVEHGFYLTGGTALSRGYYEHRYSEDLDFFVNDRPEFVLWRDRCIQALRWWAEGRGYGFDIVLREERFGRVLIQGEAPLKIEWINDVPSRIGEPWPHPLLGLLDTRENILASKITALVDRKAPKDLADVFWLCCRDGLSLVEAVDNALGKAAGIFPPLVAKALLDGLPGAWDAIVWNQPPSRELFEQGIRECAEAIMSAS